MSVQLTSKNEQFENNICNGSWAAAVAVGRAYERDKITPWDGTHDNHFWPPEQLTIMADRIEQVANLVPTLRELAANGGVTIS